jgi:hypothetical protein
LALAIGFALLFCAPARADVGIILNETLDSSIAWVTGSGHTAVYLSGICPESPVKLRLCRPGEMGSVISNYTTLGEDQPFEWNVIPLSVYLYGVEDPAHRPLIGTPQLKHALEERYRVQYLAGYCDTHECQTSNKAEWREMVAATLSRSMYFFVIHTTVDQDRAFIEQFNSEPNVNHFNGVSRNCATFARRVVNWYYPHSAHADYLNDFGMTSPKAISRSFSHYARHHPELDFHVYHFAQLPGTIKHSTEPRSGTEQLYRSKKLLIPMAIFAEYELPVVAGSYLLTGRFSPEHELEHHPADLEPPPAGRDIQSANFVPEKPGANASPADARDEVVGDKHEWKEYSEEFDAVVGDAVNDEIIPDRGYLNRFLKNLGEAGDPIVDRDGAMWLDVRDGDRIGRVGLSASNVLGQDSDAPLAYTLLLARDEYILKARKHARETMLDFHDDWQLLQDARRRVSASFATAAAPAPPSAPVGRATLVRAPR